MNLSFTKDLAVFLSQKYSVANLSIAPELCPANFDGDLTINCFILAKQLKQNPMAIAAEVQKFLADHADIAKAELVKAFVNVTLKAEALMRELPYIKTFARNEGLDAHGNSAAIRETR